MPSIADIGHSRLSIAQAGKGPAGRRKIPLPLADGLRIAQVSPRELLFAESHFYGVDQTAALCAFKPQVLLGSTAELELLASLSKPSSSNPSSSNQLVIDLSSLDRALFVITDCRDVPLRDASRNTLWRAFGVPVFELLLGGDGSPIAAECDAHEGWHVEDGISFSHLNGELWFQRKRERAQGTGLTGEIESSLCPCGRPGNRILNAAMDFRDPVRIYLAKTA